MRLFGHRQYLTSIGCEHMHVILTQQPGHVSVFVLCPLCTMKFKMFNRHSKIDLTLRAIEGFSDDKDSICGGPVAMATQPPFLVSLKASGVFNAVLVFMIESVNEPICFEFARGQKQAAAQ